MSDDNDTKELRMEDYGMEIKEGNVELGGTYPIYGMITKILNESTGDFTVEINRHIEAHLHVTEPDKINLVKERAFEPGIFVSTVIQVEPKIVVDVGTVVFGRKQNTTQQ